MAGKRVDEVSVFEGAGLLDALTRQLARTAGAGPEDRKDLNAVRVLLYSVRRRHATTWAARLPEEVARCLAGPAVEVKALTMGGGQAA